MTIRKVSNAPVAMPIEALDVADDTAAASTQDLLRTVLSSGFDPATAGAGAVTSLGPATYRLAQPAGAAPQVTQYAATAGGSPVSPPAVDQRAAQPGGFAGTYGNTAVYNQLGASAGGSPRYSAGAAMGVPSGNPMTDLANSIANAPTYSSTEQSLLNTIKDPEQRAIQELQMQMQKQAMLCTVITNLAQMRHDMLKAVAQNLRS